MNSITKFSVISAILTGVIWKLNTGTEGQPVLSYQQLLSEFSYETLIKSNRYAVVLFVNPRGDFNEYKFALRLFKCLSRSEFFTQWNIKLGLVENPHLYSIYNNKEGSGHSMFFYFSGNMVVSFEYGDLVENAFPFRKYHELICSKASRFVVDHVHFWESMP